MTPYSHLGRQTTTSAHRRSSFADDAVSDFGTTLKFTSGACPSSWCFRVFGVCFHSIGPKQLKRCLWLGEHHAATAAFDHSWGRTADLYSAFLFTGTKLAVAKPFFESGHAQQHLQTIFLLWANPSLFPITSFLSFIRLRTRRNSLITLKISLYHFSISILFYFSPANRSCNQ